MNTFPLEPLLDWLLPEKFSANNQSIICPIHITLLQRFHFLLSRTPVPLYEEGSPVINLNLIFLLVSMIVELGCEGAHYLLEGGEPLLSARTSIPNHTNHNILRWIATFVCLHDGSEQSPRD